MATPTAPRSADEAAGRSGRRQRVLEAMRKLLKAFDDAETEKAGE